MKRLRRTLPVFLASGPALAGANTFCFAGAPWCNSNDLGLAWIPIAVLLQLAFLYLSQGGPAVFLARFAGHNDDWAEQHWGVMQVGMPIALVMAFPVLAVLAVVGKWFRPVGLLEILVVQGLYWALLLHWAWRTDAAHAAQEVMDKDAMVGQMPEAAALPSAAPAGFIGIGTPLKAVRSSIDAGVAAILPRAAVDGIPLFPAAVPASATARGGASATPASPERLYAASAASFQTPPNMAQSMARADKTIDRLMKTYMWDDIGSGPPFKFVRKLQPAQLFPDAEACRFGEPLLEAMRAACRHTVAIYRNGVDTTTLPSIVAMNAVDGFDEYSADVMQRLMYSALLERHKLFIDQTDIEIFGEDFMTWLYRLALSEVQSAAAYRPVAGAIQAAGQLLLQ